MNDPILRPDPPHAHVRCLREGCGWYVAGDLDGAIADLEQHMVSMHGLDPARTRTQPRIEATDSHSIRLWKAAAESAQNHRDRLIEERDRLADELSHLRNVIRTEKPSTAVTVVHPNDEVNAVLELLEEHPNMGLDDTRDGLDLAAIAARRWRRALKEQAG